MPYSLAHGGCRFRLHPDPARGMMAFLRADGGQSHLVGKQGPGPLDAPLSAPRAKKVRGAGSKTINNKSSVGVTSMYITQQSIASTLGHELAYYDLLHHQKYRDKDQTKEQHNWKIAAKLCSSVPHCDKLYESLKHGRFLPAGRVQAATGAVQREVSPFNCSVSQTIEDDMGSIMDACKTAASILRLGTGIGYNFSRIRPRGALIRKLQTEASGPLSFMRIFDVMASTIASSGHRRGAQMGILNVDHPDIEAFIDAKMAQGAYRQFNLSVGITDSFMATVASDKDWPLQFNGTTYKVVKAGYLWEKITRNAYDSAEPGIIFIDRLNDTNNLWYCETIEATNPCAEQPLPPYGLCTLGSFNLPAYLHNDTSYGKIVFLEELFKEDIRNWVEAYDNLFDVSLYAIPEHEKEAKAKRRIGLGLTGIANAIEFLVGKSCYGEPEFNVILEKLCTTLRDEAYRASTELAKTRGGFDLFSERYLDGVFIKTLPEQIQDSIRKHGIRNSHLISYAPCGTISQCAHNVSSGVEPIFHHKVVRDVHMREGQITIPLHDYMVRNHGFFGKTLEECSVENHLEVARITQKYCDSAVSKTVNVSASCSYMDYEKIYVEAHKLGLKGITVFRPTPLRGAVIVNAQESPALTCANGVCER